AGRGTPGRRFHLLARLSRRPGHRARPRLDLRPAEHHRRPAVHAARSARAGRRDFVMSTAIVLPQAPASAPRLRALFLRKLLSRSGGLIGFSILAVVILTALLAPWLAP